MSDALAIAAVLAGLAVVGLLLWLDRGQGYILNKRSFPRHREANLRAQAQVSVWRRFPEGFNTPPNTEPARLARLESAVTRLELHRKMDQRKLEDLTGRIASLESSNGHNIEGSDEHSD
jgi:hypothetical protein